MAVQISGNDITVPRDGTFSRNVSIAGTLTYEDVTNVDSIGLVTARNGIEVGASPGVAASISVDGNAIFSGITTIGSKEVGAGITLSPDGDGFFTGVITATSYSGIDLSDVTGATGDFSIADKIVHTGDTNTAIRFPAADTITAETGGTERLRIASDGLITQKTGDLIIDQTNNGYGGLRIVDSSAGEYSVSYILGRNSGLSAHIFKYYGRTQNQSPWENNGTGNEMGRWTAAGIAFNGDTAAANSLSDYEEGTFNPTMVNSVTLHSGNDTLGYIKVGKMVTVTGVIRIDSSNGGQEVSINNMPFATANTAEGSGNGIGSASLYDQDMPSGYTQCICVMNPNSQILNVIVQRQSSNNSASLLATSNGYVGVSITYKSA